MALGRTVGIEIMIFRHVARTLDTADEITHPLRQSRSFLIMRDIAFAVCVRIDRFQMNADLRTLRKFSLRRKGHFAL